MYHLDEARAVLPRWRNLAEAGFPNCVLSHRALMSTHVALMLRASLRGLPVIPTRVGSRLRVAPTPRALVGPRGEGLCARVYVCNVSSGAYRARTSFYAREEYCVL